MKAVKRKRALLNDIKKVAIYLYKNYTSGRNTKMSDQLRLDAEEERLKEQTESLETQLTLQKQQFKYHAASAAKCSFVPTRFDPITADAHL